MQGCTVFVSLVSEGVCLINQCFLIYVDLAPFLVLCSLSLSMMSLLPLDVTCCLCLSAFVLNHKLEANLITDYLGKVSKTVLEHCICGTHSI